MPIYEGTKLTRIGLTIMAQLVALGDVTTKPTRIALGSGEWPDNEDLEQAVMLKNERFSFPVTEREVHDPSTAYISGLMDSRQNTTPFTCREVGLFVEDPITKEERLYAITRVASPGDAIPAGQYITELRTKYRLLVAVANAANIEITVTDPDMLEYINKWLENHFANWQGIGGTLNKREEFIIGADGQQTFNLSVCNARGVTHVFVDGHYKSKLGHYTIVDGSTIRFADPLPAGARDDVVELRMGDGEIPPVAVEGITLDQSAITLPTGSTQRLIATVAPPNADNHAITWSSGTPGVATVDSNGVVTAAAVGNASIVATTVDGGHVAICTVNVIPVAVTGITLNRSAATLKVGETLQLVQIVVPASASNKGVTWDAQGKLRVSINQNGLVTALNPGVEEVRVTSAENSAYCAICTVTVEANIIQPTGITLSSSIIGMTVTGSTTIQASIQPSGAIYDSPITFHVSGANGVISLEEVDAMPNARRVRALSPGLVTIEARATYQGKIFSAFCAVTINALYTPVNGISIAGPSQIEVGQRVKLTATVLPAGATNKSVIWMRIDDPSPYGNGMAFQLENWAPDHLGAVIPGSRTPETWVKGFVPGTYTVYCDAEDGSGISGAHTITVVPAAAVDVPVEGIAPAGHAPIDGVYHLGFSLYGGESTQTEDITFNVSPANATNQAVDFALQNPDGSTYNGSSFAIAGIDHNRVQVAARDSYAGDVAKLVATARGFNNASVAVFLSFTA